MRHERMKKVQISLKVIKMLTEILKDSLADDEIQDIYLYLLAKTFQVNLGEEYKKASDYEKI